jgi:hypothetical protein
VDVNGVCFFGQASKADGLVRAAAENGLDATRNDGLMSATVGKRLVNLGANRDELVDGLHVDLLGMLDRTALSMGINVPRQLGRVNIFLWHGKTVTSGSYVC